MTKILVVEAALELAFQCIVDGKMWVSSTILKLSSSPSKTDYHIFLARFMLFAKNKNKRKKRGVDNGNFYIS